VVTVNAQDKPYEPQVGQPGKDTVWVPTPEVLVEKMLDMAKVTPQDFVIDLGSGDGRNVIAAAKRGARGIGVEYNPDMVGLSKRLATEAGVSDKATFVEGDMFEADISKATVLALFLLPDNMGRLRPKFLDLRPGTRIVANTFGIEGWEPDETQEVSSDLCSSWCTSLLFIVPAKVAGTWKTPQGELTLQQEYQVVSGSMATGGGNTPIANGRLRGDQIRFIVADSEYTGRVNGATIEGTVRTGGRQSNWTATRSR
jgi:SAM-dependent methyltransferase